VSQDLGFTGTGNDRSWRAEWTERLERIDQHLVELNEALLLLLALDDLTRDVLVDRPAAGESQAADSSNGERTAGVGETLREIRAALEGPIRRLEAVADRLASATAKFEAVANELQERSTETRERYHYERPAVGWEKPRPSPTTSSTAPTSPKARQSHPGNLVAVRPIRSVPGGKRAVGAPVTGPTPDPATPRPTTLGSSPGRQAPSSNPDPNSASPAGSGSNDTGKGQETSGRRRWFW
jgi:hypothetical protein